MKKWLWVLLVIVLAVGGFGAYTVLNQGTTARAQAQQIEEETAVATEGELRVAISANGSLAPARSVSLAFSSTGRVAEIWVQEGDRVQAGQTLARLDTEELELQVTQAEANLASAQAQLAELQAPPAAEDMAAAEASLRSAEAQYRKVADGKSAEEITMAQTNVKKAEAALAQAQAAYDKVAWRPDIAALAQSADLQRATQDYENAVANYRLTTKGASAEDLVIAKASVDNAKAQLDRVQAAPSAESVVIREAAIAQAQASLDTAKLRLAQATLTVPFDGIVTTLNIEVGQMAAGTAVTVADLAHMEVEVLLNENDIAQVQPDQTVQLHVDAYPQLNLTGAVTAIAATEKVQSGVVLYPVTVAVGDAPEGVTLRSGMTTEAEIVMNVKTALKVPLAAIRTENGQTVVLKKVAQTLVQSSQGAGTPVSRLGFEAVPVVVGLTVGGEAEILGGLSAGDIVSITSVTMKSPSTTGLSPRPMGGLFGGGAQ